MSDATSRRFPRFASNHSVLVSKLDGDVEEFAMTKTLALGGCCVVSAERLGAGSPVELLIAIDREHVIKALGRVAYEHVLEDGYSDVGIEFVSLSDEDARVIEEMFERREPQQPVA
ncbi:MAG TPA: PilZ domain-containing protein [Thermoanaerobaculia bacterium]|nr:PilZ domain-containing protein [Thermoanaerobaculia bacterium]